MKIAFLTADTYRIAATEQLRVYANILDAPMSIIYSAEEMNAAIERVSEYDLILLIRQVFPIRMMNSAMI